MTRRHHIMGMLTVLLIGAAILFWPSQARSLIASHECNYCHNLHGAPGFSLLSDPQVEALCLTCHGAGGISALKADVHSNNTPKSNYPPFRVSCRGCHNPHDNVANWVGGTNIKLVGAVTSTRGYAGIVTVNSGTRDVVFENRGSTADGVTLHSFADSDEDGNGYYDGVCEICHTLTGHHRNNTPDPTHHTGDTCTRCHVHANRFMK